MRLNFLMLHGQGIYRPARFSTINHLEFLERYGGGEHNFLYHRWDEPLTNILRVTQFHVVVLSTTALRICRHRPRENYYRVRDAWSFVADSDAIKLVFPQDDYHQTNELDLLFAGWGVDIVYSVLPKHMAMLYPRSGKSAELKGVLTGYVDDNSARSMAKFSKPFDQRTHDVFQRVTNYPLFGGYYAQIKSQMASGFERIGRRTGLAMDISTRLEDVVEDECWMECLGNSRFALGCESGVSLWDPEGIYRDRVEDYVMDRGDVPFDEVEAACFPGEDGRYVFSAVSPRLFESAMMRCSPILVEGEYLGLLHPWEHYIPVRPDLVDIEDAIEAMGDLKAAKRRAAACYETLVDNRAFRYSTLAEKVMGDIERLSVGRGFRETDSRQFRRIVEDHQAEVSAWRTWDLCRPVVDYGSGSPGSPGSPVN